jgi:hypothetical protein
MAFVRALYASQNFADLLDYSRNTFDRDFLEFNVNVAELETALQGFINASFENITSTEHALNLLKQFEAILQRDTLKSDLDSKYIVIFHNYGLDLETVQKIYDKQVDVNLEFSTGYWFLKLKLFRTETISTNHSQCSSSSWKYSMVKAPAAKNRAPNAQVQK